MSSRSINHVVLTGNLTRDPELHVLPSGTSVCKMRMASNSRRREAATGEWVDKPNFFDVAVFGPQAETVAKYMFKGRPLALEGRLDWHEWETKEGRKAQDVSIIADNVQFIGDPARTGASVDADDGLSVTDGDAGLDASDIAAMAALSEAADETVAA